MWRPLTRKGRCRRPHEKAPAQRPRPPSKDRRYGKPHASVTGSTYANHSSARSPKPTQEGPARDNLITGPRAGATRSEPSAPASAVVIGRHNEPGSRPASACPAQPPSKAGGASPGGGERHHGVGKADWGTQRDQIGGGAAHHAGPRGTPERHTAGHNQGKRAGARQQRPPDAAEPESPHNTQRTTARDQVPSNPSCCLYGRVRALQRAQRLLATKQAPSGWTSARAECTQPLPGMNSPRPNSRVSAQQRRPAHATPQTQPTAQHIERAHRRTGAKSPRTPHAQHNTQRGHTGEQDQSAPGHRTHNTTHRAGTPVNRSQVARDTAQAKQQTEHAHG